ncbi:MAG TPA: bifunctional 3-(3-hydroxy-phenyl)propionate/3-hydroxycinnamic acid hydroxylase [Ilumatobacteraceae bacterium]|nr:bifunctional 3-(3-hydroxy-phenyl)propionate/3-hydroxycinnamic acid hydroxylase [Ilumatobacteraceae bacterium]
MNSLQTDAQPPQHDVTDVAIVGYGPVGAVLAILLAQRGWRVSVLERWAEPYPLPRAVHFDHEAGRILQSCGVTDAVTKITEPVEVYEFQNADRQPLVRFGRVGQGLSGWPQSSMFSQPDLEAVLYERVAELPTVEVHRGVQVVDLDDEGTAVTVRGQRVEAEGDVAGRRSLRVLGDAPSVHAHYVVGCDGANSTIRAALGVDMVDRAFFYDWLIVDVIFAEPRIFDPLNVQICDPARPTTCVSGGPGRRRWEFMALPGETPEQLNDETTAWRLLEPWGATPQNARLERHAVYRFQARWVQEWRKGRVLLAGDAAHQTPPFAGQGLCAGLRDAANLAWKLDMVLSGLAPDSLLDTYGPERAPNMKAVIELAIDMGKMICASSPEEVSGRDEMLLAGFDGSLTDIPPFPGITEGVILAGSPQAGALFLQADVERGDVRLRFDDTVGAGWRLVTNGPTVLHADTAAWFAGIDGVVVQIGGPDGFGDVDGAYGRWFAEYGVVAVLQRPDFVVFGTAREPSEVSDLVDSLKRVLAGD